MHFMVQWMFAVVAAASAVVVVVVVVATVVGTRSRRQLRHRFRPKTSARYYFRWLPPKIRKV